MHYQSAPSVFRVQTCPFFNIQCICVTKTPFVCQDNLFFRSASPDYHSATPESEKEVWRQKNFRVSKRFLGRKLKYNLSSRLDLSSFRQCRGRGCKKRSLRKKIRPFLGTRFRPHPLPSNFKKVFSVPLDLKFGL